MSRAVRLANPNGITALILPNGSMVAMWRLWNQVRLAVDSCSGKSKSEAFCAEWLADVPVDCRRLEATQHVRPPFTWLRCKLCLTSDALHRSWRRYVQHHDELFPDLGAAGTEDQVRAASKRDL